jgi:hypothetical protein
VTSANLNDRPVSARRPSRFFRKDGDLPEWVTLEDERPSGFDHLGAAEWGTLLGERIRAVQTAALDKRQLEGRRLLGRAIVVRRRPTAQHRTKCADK